MRVSCISIHRSIAAIDGSERSVGAAISNLARSALPGLEHSGQISRIAGAVRNFIPRTYYEGRLPSGSFQKFVALKLKFDMCCEAGPQ